MTTNVKLTRAMFNGSQAHLGTTWVTNGHWALRRDSIANCGILASCDTLRDALGLSEVTELQSESFVPTGLQLTDAWHTTRFLFETDDGRTLIRILKREGKGELAGVNNAYLKMIGADDEFQTLYAKSAESAFVLGDDPSVPTFVVMPFRLGNTNGNQDGLEQQVRALGVLADVPAIAEE